ncbi:MAG TPA: nuclear transport factor 2 family protein [Alphaproteobacteria bacterium]|nr:nuclear transport factor 2 family protein [Alphaproteobacteria bacterium]
MSNMRSNVILKAVWEAVERGDLEALTAFYSDDMIFVFPGQNDILRGRAAFRSVLETMSDALPPGFEITNVRYFSGEKDGEIVNVVEWKSTKLPTGTQSAVLWKFNAANKIAEERWYIDTEQWKVTF